jgi:carotenoid 1,2-hydratase
LSDDGRHGLTIIAFVGSVFSPYYANARKRGRADPRDYCAINVALYGEGARRWTMTERRRGALTSSRDALAIGPSSLRWQDDALVIAVDEWAAPIPQRVRGRIRLQTTQVHDHDFHLDAEGRHCWRPIAPAASVSVELDRPGLAWSGHGYFDTNRGEEPLEDGFAGWDWSRMRLADGSTAVMYDVRRRDSKDLSLALRFTPAGQVDWICPPARVALPATRWGITRTSRGEGTPGARIERTLEDTPFYARSLLTTCVNGEVAPTVHESLSLDRFRSRWVQTLLPFRMPRTWR